MNARPPTKLSELARDLGIKAKQLESLRVKYKTESKLRKTLQRWWCETREEPRLLARRSGDRGTGYTSERHVAMRGQMTDEGYEDEPEAVHEDYQNLLTMQAHSRHAETEQIEHAQRVATQQAKQLTRKLRKLQGQAAAMGVDLTPRLVRMVREAEHELAQRRREAA